MDIFLNLEKHCIETEIKRLHNRCISRYFKRDGDLPMIEAELELLADALKTLDFAALRSRYPQLAGQGDAPVVLTRAAGAPVVVLIDGEPVGSGVSGD